jgi:hypothetical protein
MGCERNVLISGFALEHDGAVEVATGEEYLPRDTADGSTMAGGTLRPEFC